MDNYNETKQPQAIVAMVVCLCLLAVSLSARLYAQHSIKHLWELDNVLIVVASLLCLVTIIICFVAMRFGLGLHLTRVIAEDPQRPANIERVSLTGYLVTVLQCPTLSLIKFSILSFYRRIFSSSRARQRIFTYALYIIGLYVILLGIASAVEFIAQCRPIHYFWDAPAEIYALAGKPNFPASTGWCIPVATGYGIPLIAGLVSDLMILGLPAVGLWNLQLRLSQKIGVFVSLSLGVFACIIEVVRIVFVFNVTQIYDTTWINSDAMTWTAVESTVAITCANIAAAAPLLKTVRESQRRPKWLRQSGWGSYTSSKILSLKARFRRTRNNPSDDDTDSSTDYMMAQTAQKPFLRV